MNAYLEVAATKDRLAREWTEIQSSTIGGQRNEQESHNNESSEPPLNKRNLGS